MVLVSLADVAWVLLLLLRLDIPWQLGTIVKIIVLLLQLMVLGLSICLLLRLLLDVLEHDLHVDLILTTTFASVNLFRDQGCIPLARV